MADTDAPSTSAPAAAPSTERPPWRRILYEDQSVYGYPDNYTDPNFDPTAIPKGSGPFDVRELMHDSLIITQQLSTVIAFCVIYSHVYYERLSARVLLIVESSLFVGAWVLRRNLLTTARPTAAMLRSDARQLILLVGWLLCLSPVLATLTRTFSYDTICVLTLSLFAAHLLLHDYEYALDYSSTFQGATSMNAAIFASVILAAQLPSTHHVFALMLLATQTFVLLPAQRRTLSQALGATQQLGFAILVFGLTAALLLLTVSWLLAAGYLVGVFTVSGFCPWLFVRIKNANFVDEKDKKQS